MSVVEATGPIRFAPIDGAVGDNMIVEPVAGMKIRPLHIYLHQAAAGTILFESDDDAGSQTAVSGTIPTTSENLKFDPGYSPVGYFETLVGEGLNMALGTATADGWIAYQEVG